MAERSWADEVLKKLADDEAKAEKKRAKKQRA